MLVRLPSSSGIDISCRTSERVGGVRAERERRQEHKANVARKAHTRDERKLRAGSRGAGRRGEDRRMRGEEKRGKETRGGEECSTPDKMLKKGGKYLIILK